MALATSGQLLGAELGSPGQGGNVNGSQHGGSSFLRSTPSPDGSSYFQNLPWPAGYAQHALRLMFP